MMRKSALFILMLSAAFALVVTLYLRDAPPTMAELTTAFSSGVNVDQTAGIGDSLSSLTKTVPSRDLSDGGRITIWHANNNQGIHFRRWMASGVKLNDVLYVKLSSFDYLESQMLSSVDEGVLAALFLEGKYNGVPNPRYIDFHTLRFGRVEQAIITSLVRLGFEATNVDTHNSPPSK